MKRLFLNLLFLLYAITGFGQIPVIEWQKSLGGSEEDRAYSVKQTLDSGYIIAGTTRSSNGDVKGFISSTDYWVVKLTATGLIQWRQCLGSNGYDWGADVILTKDSCYLISGYITDTSDMISHHHGDPGIPDCWLVKLDQKGHMLWEKSFGGTGNDGSSYDGPTVKTRQTFDGGYILATSTWSSDGDVSYNHGDADYWVVKMDDTGHIQWQKSFGGSDYDVARSVQQTKDSGYIIIGQSRSSDGDVNTARGNDDYWVLKLDRNGNIQWQRSYGGGESDVGTDIIQITGGYIMTGYSSSSDGDVSGHYYSADYWVVRIDDTGKIIWQQSLGGTGGDFSYSLCSTPDGACIVSGHSYSFDGTATGGYMLSDYWLIKMSLDGRIIWTKKMGGWNEEFCYEITPTLDSGYILAGYSGSNDHDVSHHRGANDFWIVKLYYPKPVNIPESGPGTIGLVYPNPARDQLTLAGCTTSSPYYITDMYGSTWIQGIADPGSAIIRIESLLPGAYILHLGTGQKQMFTVIR